MAFAAYLIRLGFFDDVESNHAVHGEVNAVTRKPAKAGRSQYYHVTDGEWIEIPMRNHMDQCCDCGLIHRMNFRINTKGRIEVQAFRDARATNGARRYFAFTRED